MKLLKKTKKGFTLVELVVVIAVIAILSGVGVGTYIAVTNNAKKSSDQQVLDQVNKCLMVHENLPGGGKPVTMQETLDVLDAEMGVADVQKLLTNTFSGYSFAWDKPQDRFVILEGDNIAYKDANYPSSRTYSGNEGDFWKMVSTVDSNALCSQYVTGTTYPDEEVTVKAGLDLGNNLGIKKVKYERLDASDSKEVTINTNSHDVIFEVNADKDSVIHYGEASKVEVTAVAMSSYHEFGDVLGNINLAKGNVVVEQGCKASAVVIDMTAAELATVTSIAADNSKATYVPIILNTTQYAWNKNAHKNLVDPSKNKILYTLSGETENPEEMIPYKALTNDSGYLSFNDALVASVKGDTIRMLSDDSANFNAKLKAGDKYYAAILIQKDLAIDLNGHILSLVSDYGFFLNDSAVKLTLKDSAPTDSSKFSSPYSYLVYLNKGTFVNENASLVNTGNVCVYHSSGEVIINGGLIQGKTNAYTFANEGTLTVNNGRFIGNNYSIATNGNYASGARTIVINNGIFENAIYKPDGGTLTINGGYFTGTTCVYVKGGTLNITGGTFIANKGDGDWMHRDDGIAKTGDAVIVEGCNYPAGNPFAKITGGTFQGYKKDGGTEPTSMNVYFKNYGILIINFNGKTTGMNGTTIPYRLAVVPSNDAEGFISESGYIHFTDSNTTLVNP